MEEKHLNSWEAFEAEIRELRQQREDTRESVAPIGVSRFLFRGQGHHAWPLETTLERNREEPWRMSEYYNLISKVCPQIDTFTGSRWELEDYMEISKWLSEYDGLFLKPFPGYEYCVYLRHHGFPSPLLDWTQSPYIAAYFAFAHSHSKPVAVYVYLEYAGSGKSGSSDKSLIRSLGPYVRSHKRHFLQRSEYTISAKYLDDDWWYAPHEEAFADAPETQDKLWKFTMPAGERCKVLKIFDSFNLNEFSLFQTEEALLRTIALRELELNS